MRLLKLGCAAVVVMFFIAGLVLSYRRAILVRQFAIDTLDVSMHDPNALHSQPWYNRQIGARLRLPADLSSPSAVTIPETRYSFSAIRPGRDACLVSLIDQQGASFRTAVLAQRQGLLNLKWTILREGGTEIQGRHAYVIEAINPKGMFPVPVHGRFYCIPGDGTQFYALTIMCRDSDWPAFANVSDSCASTFEVGSWPPAAPVATPTVPSRTPSRTHSGIPPAPFATARNHQPPSGDEISAIPPRVMQTPRPPSIPAVHGPDSPTDSSLARGLTGFPPPHPSPRTPPTDIAAATGVHGPTEVLVNGRWLHAFVLQTRGDRSRVRYFDPGKPSQVVWVTQDHLRPLPTGGMLAGEPEINRMAPPARPVAPAAISPKRSPAPSAPAAEALTVNRATQLLLLPSSADQARGANFLAGVTPDADHRDTVIRALTVLFGERNSESFIPAARALGTWADDSTERYFISRLATASHQERHGIFEMLGARKTPAAARAVAARLRVSEDVMPAETAIEQMGAIAEPAVRALLSDNDRMVRKYAIEELAAIGTRASLSALQPLSTSGDSLLAPAAEKAIERIQNRTSR